MKQKTVKDDETPLRSNEQSQTSLSESPDHALYAGKHKRRWAAPLGAVILLFALVGIISVVLLAISGFQQAAQRRFDAAAAEYERLIAPLVMFDPDPFEKVGDASEPALLSASIMDALGSEPDLESDDYGRTLLSADLVKRHCKQLFGASVFSQFETVYIDGMLFEYDTDAGCYKIPVTSDFGIYEPKVQAIKKKGDTIVLKVGYLSTVDRSSDKIVKQMNYILKKNGDKTTISAVQKPTAAE